MQQPLHHPTWHPGRVSLIEPVSPFRRRQKMTPLGEESSKKRLYIAYYAQPEDSAAYHTALLLVLGQLTEAVQDTVRFHVVRVLPTGATEPTWKYGRVNVVVRTPRLTAVQLLGEVSSNGELEVRMHKILRAIPMVQNDEAWTCYHWVWRAVQVRSFVYG